jgi:Flp pilus assembly protein TadG
MAEVAPRTARGARFRIARRRACDEDGQATVELVAAVPALLLAALLSLQLLAAGYSLTLADGAAEAGALALAEGGSAAEAARHALPGWAADSVSVTVRGEEVSVRLRPPSPFGAVADHLAVTSSASARSAE